MPINWFPGHMNKARREIAKAMPKMDLILEVLDARIPFSSENPLVPELREDTPCLKLLNKCDLADPAVTKAWITELEKEQGITAMAVHRKAPKEIKSILKLAPKIARPGRSKSRPVAIMVLGIPNVGKSTIINTLSGKIIAKTGNVPAVTKKQQQVRAGRNIVLHDTPGFLWPKLSPEECGYRLAVTGAIKDAVIDYVDIAFFAAKFLGETYPEALTKRYDLDEIPSEPEKILEAIGVRRACVGKGGDVNFNKVSEILIRELRQGALGPLSLESP